MMDACKTVLLVEGEYGGAGGLSQRLQRLGYRVVAASSWEAVTERLHPLPPLDLVLMEIDPQAGREAIEAFQRRLEVYDLPVVFLAGAGEAERMQRLEPALSYGYVLKEAGDPVLAVTLKMALKLHEARRRQQQAAQALEQAGLALQTFEQRYVTEVQQVQQDLARLLSRVPDLYFRMRMDGTILSYLGSQAKDLYVPVEQFIGKRLEDVLPPTASAPILEAVARTRAAAQAAAAPADAAAVAVEYSLPMQGGVHTYEARLFPLEGDELVAIVQDITGRKQIEQALRESETRFRLTWMETPAGLELFDGDGWLVDMNPTCLKILGVSDVEAVRGLNLLADPKISPQLKAQLRQGEAVRFEAVFDFDRVRQQGLFPTSRTGQCDFEVIIRPLPGADTITGYLMHVQDVTERKQYEAAQARALKEKNTLLGDLQHRIKNSLNMITSLIQLEQFAAVHPETQGALEDLHGRVHSLADLYGLLYETKNVEHVQLGAYLGRVADSLARSYGYSHQGVRLWVRCAETVVFAQPATAFGLILNELLTNAFKYAFPGERPGNIWVELGLDAGQVVLSVADDGVGPPPGFCPRQSSGMGMQIVQMLAEELRGQLDYRRDEQTVFVVRAPCAEVACS